MALTTEAARLIYTFSTPGSVSTAATTIDLDSAIAIDPGVVVNAARVAWTANLVSLTTDEWFLGDVTLYVPSGGGSIPYVASGSTPGATGTPTSAAVSLLVTKRTNIGGRRGKGRMFLPPPPQNQVNADGVIAAGFLATSRGHLSDFFNDLTAIDPSVQPVVHTRASGGLPAGNTLITELWLEAEVATQRRRQRR